MTTATAQTLVEGFLAQLYSTFNEIFTNTGLVTTVIFVLVAFAAIRLAKNLWHKKV